MPASRAAEAAGGRASQRQPRAEEDFGAGAGRTRGSRCASARFPRTNKETSRFSGKKKTKKPHNKQIPMTAATSIKSPDTHAKSPQSHRDTAGTLQRGDAGRRRRGSPAPRTRWASFARAEPLSPQGRRVGTAGLSRTAFGCCCYFGGGRVGGLLFLLYLTCSPLLLPSWPLPLLLLLSLFLSLPPSLSVWPSATSVNCYICTIYTRQTRFLI